MDNQNNTLGEEGQVQLKIFTYQISLQYLLNGRKRVELVFGY